jgi:hypothetical protein
MALAKQFMVCVSGTTRNTSSVQENARHASSTMVGELSTPAEDTSVRRYLPPCAAGAQVPVSKLIENCGYCSPRAQAYFQNTITFYLTKRFHISLFESTIAFAKHRVTARPRVQRGLRGYLASSDGERDFYHYYVLFVVGSPSSTRFCFCECP